jgi:hypothetical protein
LQRLAGLMLAVAAAGASAQFSLPPIQPPAIPVPQPLLGELQVTLNGPTDGGQWYGSVHSTSVVPAIGCGSNGACRQTYPNGLSVGLMAMPVAGAIFDGWSGSCAGSSSTCGVSIAGGQTRHVQARFLPTRVQVELVGPDGMATDLRFQASSTAPAWQQTCTRRPNNPPTCTYDLPRGATHVELRPQPVDGRYPTLSCSGAASCATTVSNALRVNIVGQSRSNPTAIVRLELGLNGLLLVQKVNEPECARANTSRGLTVTHSGGGPATLIAPGVPASAVAVPLGGTATVTAAMGTTVRWLGCIGSTPTSQPLVLGNSCRVDLASNPAIVTACMQP